ncbi:hypothetical protein [Bacillus glycinifermentans]|uniref:hypothetical protein n=1 Tax=Bacillus glycinifermentans TaxID=1664069 RepID=UPI001F3FC6BA|nr:hypothetical protein [Bacillus glycinifermentans]
MGILDEIGFTPEQYKTLSKHMSDEEIAQEELLVSGRTLSAWKQRNGIKSDRTPSGRKFTREEWEEKRREGLKEQQIAAFFGYKTFKLYIDYKKSIGIPNLSKERRIKRTPEFLDEIQNYLKDGLTVKEIAEKLNVDITPAYLGRIIKEEGLRDDAKIVRSVINKIRNQQEKGLKKYGVPVSVDLYSLRGWLQHALEETLDKAVYLEAAIQKIDEIEGGKRK